MPKHLNLPPAGPSFYAHVFHPAYNLDAEELAETTDRFANHTRAVGKGVQGMRDIFSQVRQARVGAWSGT
jgi:sorting nexin-9/18/33